MTKSSAGLRAMNSLLCMEENIDDRLDIETIADRVGLSRRQLERIFQSKTGFSPAVAYEKICMKKAAQLVERTSKTVIEIALDVGFANSSHFCRRFRANFGMTPNKLREKMRSRGQKHLVAEDCLHRTAPTGASS